MPLCLCWGSPWGSQNKILRNFREFLKKKKPAKPCNIKAWREKLGGDNRDRTGDLLNAIQALSQDTQSYTPECGRLYPHSGDAF